MSRIQTNTAANTAYRNVTFLSNQMEKSIQKLSSGFRINRSADDAAGLSIANRLRQENRGLQQAARNASQAGSVLQIADGAVSTISDILSRIKELATQASSDNVTASDRTKINAEFVELRAEINRIVDNTQYQGSTLLDGTFGVQLDAGSSTAIGVAGISASSISLTGAQASTTFTFTDAGSGVITLSSGSGAGAVSQSISYTAGQSQTLTFDKLGVSLAVTNYTAGALDGLAVATGAAAAATFRVGSTASADSEIAISLGNLKTAAGGLDLDGLDLTTFANAETVLSRVDTALAQVNSLIGTIGAAQSRLEYAQANLASRVQNNSAAESVIRDADMAYEMTVFTKTQVLQQAGTAMLAQANQTSQNVLQLLRG